MSFFDYLVVFFAPWIGETFGTIFGGGGFFIQPALLLVGVPPHSAVANDITAAGFSSLFFAYFMYRKGHVDLNLALAMIPPAIIGAIFGSTLFTTISPASVEIMVLAICLMGIVYMAWELKPKAVSHKKWHLTKRAKLLAAIAAGLFIGIYDGFSAAGSGIALIALIAMFSGMDTKKVIGTANMVGTASLFTAGLNFVHSGLVDYTLLAIMIPANILAAYTASWIVGKVSERNLRIAFIVVALAVLIVLVLERMEWLG